MSNNKDAQYAIQFKNETFLLLAQGAIFWPAQKILIVSDLHLEKGSYFVQRGNLLPGYDTRDTLQRLEQLIVAYQPDRVVCLGDNFHDQIAVERMHSADYQYLCELNKKAEWLWIIGNHDKDVAHPLLNPFCFLHTLTINNTLLTHDFTPQAMPQIIGHFHPKMTLNIREQIIKGKCFVVGEKIIVMPSFGSYTGGLDIHAPAFQEVLDGQKKQYFFLKKDKIWKISNEQKNK